jgi:RimJ/RimL family protein N-acetyltransferase
MSDWPTRATLEGRVVRLEPLSRSHIAGLAEIATNRAIWRWMPVPAPASRADVEALVEAALALTADGRTEPFATIELASGRPIGSTRYLEIVPEHRRLEIGWTWVAPAWQRTAANSEAKLLMLGHAFEGLGCRRVEFKTHAGNDRSRAALLGIGATFEGVFRKHMSMPDGSIRDSAWYSILDDEWPAVRAHLEARVERLLRAVETP